MEEVLNHLVLINLLVDSFATVAQVKQALNVSAPNGVEIVNFKLPALLQV